MKKIILFIAIFLIAILALSQTTLAQTKLPKIDLAGYEVVPCNAKSPDCGNLEIKAEMYFGSGSFSTTDPDNLPITSYMPIENFFIDLNGDLLIRDKLAINEKKSDFAGILTDSGMGKNQMKFIMLRVEKKMPSQVKQGVEVVCIKKKSLVSSHECKFSINDSAVFFEGQKVKKIVFVREIPPSHMEILGDSIDLLGVQVDSLVERSGFLMNQHKSNEAAKVSVEAWALMSKRIILFEALINEQFKSGLITEAQKEKRWPLFRA